ncbi:unnamed protein product [Callosobruchus maculatus]|uniref:EF-hand domain-containing protein n=1 Tax=Callosobruchus maculatus TaxID=64391 RepID=A0A653BXW8_CALMS|nr:unnamed protein product [Callosobruchus maculatus]
MLNFYVYILAMRFRKISLYSKLCVAFRLQQYNQNVGSGELEFEEFVTLASRFMVEEDAEAMQQELKEAFRLYDKEGNGYITTSTLKEILKELDDKLTSDELDMMIQEIDTDGSGTVDFDALTLSTSVRHKRDYLIRTGGGSSHRLNISHKMLGYFKPSSFDILMRVPWTSIPSYDAVVKPKVKVVTMEDLDREQLSMLKSTFDAFDVDRKGYIEADMIGTVMDMLGTHVSADELDKIITEIDEDSNGEISFEEFANLAARFLVEDDEDTEAIQVELKGAFRLYDREGNGFITTDVLREILREIQSSDDWLKTYLSKE